MNLKHLKDEELLSHTQQLVKSEREVLTKILHHLREVERRKLFSDLGYQSLFEYTVKELKYSEGQAGRRIQAMRLIKEIPEVEEKIATGKLSLSNISQAQSYFREAKKMGGHSKLQNLESKTSEPQKKLETKDKLRILESLHNKSAREGQKILIQMQPQIALPKERERVLSETHTEVRFVMTVELKNQLQELRSLLGPKSANMNLAELVGYMARVSLNDLKTKKFGKKRVSIEIDKKVQFSPRTKEVRCENKTDIIALEKSSKTPTSESRGGGNNRHVPRCVQYQIWARDNGKCCNCGSQRNLNIDHIKPIALGGKSDPENLRLLCFHCNQRQAMKVFGVNHIHRLQVLRQRQSSK